MPDGLTTPTELDIDLSAEVRRRAARTIASMATSADECADLLAMLGLTPEEGQSHTQAA